MKKVLLGVLFAAGTLWFSPLFSKINARPKSKAIPAPSITSSSIGGVVTSTKGPEAGVWVIAETRDLPTGFRKIVVTDDQGRYVVPDLPKGNYKLWVRGYGLVDSKPVEAAPGKAVNLQAVIAPSALAAAQYYPASYWYSLIQIPDKSAFPMEKEGIKNQLDWIARMKTDMQLIQIGDKATREIPEALGKFNSDLEAWKAWTQNAESPVSLARLNKDLGLKMYADWTERIEAGEVPPAPARPEGVERNAVITEWDWSDAKGFIHDEITTDPRHPSVNANGLVYGPEQFSADLLDVLDPNTGKTERLPVPMRDPNMPANYNRPSPLTWGNENVRPAKMRLHSPMIDDQGRLWLTARFRMPEDQPQFCKQGSSHPSAKFFPIPRNPDLELELFDPETKQFTMIDTCFGTHHLEFAEDPDNTLWFSDDFPNEGIIGWLDTKVYLATHDEAKAQGWCPYILDTNGNGKVDEYVGPNDPVDPTKDKRIQTGTYGLAYNPVDGSLWQGVDRYPGAILRTSPGPNPPYTCLTEIYNSPAGTANPKSVSVDRSTGIVWVAFSASNTFASFDRRKCKVLNGPKATGDHCPEGWTLYPQPGPKFKGVNDPIGTDWYYLNWVDQFNALGLGKNVPLAPGTNSDSIVALLPNNNKFVVLRVPYPLGFYSRGMDGRIDDANAGWKGKGLWSTYATISPWHIEGGKGQSSKLVKFQIRPDPLAN